MKSLLGGRVEITISTLLYFQSTNWLSQHSPTFNPKHEHKPEHIGTKNNAMQV
jgi:hypothetical protein